MLSLLGDLGACPAKFEFRLLLMLSGIRLLFNTCDKTIITILNLKISGGNVAWGGGGGNSSPPIPSI